MMMMMIVTKFESCEIVKDDDDMTMAVERIN